LATDDITPAIDEFVARYITSIETLEVLLLLFQSKERAWTAEEVQGQIRSSVSSVTKNLRHLVTAQLVNENAGRFQYRSRSATIDAQIATLGEAYRSRRVSIIELIYRERVDPLRSFSDAFKLRNPNDR
jgi:hypothetical protein